MRQDRSGAEKTEKAVGEKNEKYEKHEYVFIGPLAGGLILMFLGIVFYLLVKGGVAAEILWASFFIVVGLVIIAAAAYGLLVARHRHPRV